MSKAEFKKVINEHMRYIDELLSAQHIPLFERYIHAALVFVDVAIEDSSFKSKEELTKSDVF